MLYNIRYNKYWGDDDFTFGAKKQNFATHSRA